MLIICLIEEHIFPVNSLSCMLLNINKKICVTFPYACKVNPSRNLQDAFWADAMLLAKLFPELKPNLIPTLPQLEHNHLARHLGLLCNLALRL